MKKYVKIQSINYAFKEKLKMSKNNFHPDNSKKPYTNEELFDRYARPQGKNEKPFVDRFNDAVNTKNGELFKYSAVAYLNGPNLDCICTELSRFNTRIVNQGYTLRIENIIADIFSFNIVLIFKSNRILSISSFINLISSISILLPLQLIVNCPIVGTLFISIMKSLSSL